MAYQKTEWKARQGSTLKRFEKSQETSKSVILNNAPTEITEPGTPFSAANMNKIEEGIHEAHEIVAEHIADTDKHISPTERLAWDGKQNALNRTISANVNNTYSAVDTGGDLSIGIRVDMETPSASNFQVVSAIYPLFQVLKIFANNIAAIFQQIAAHFIDKENPHAVTKAQVGLGNVDNTPDASKPISAAAQSALNNKQNKFIKSICETAAATVAKEITIAGYTLVAGDIFEITYTLGNTANSATISVNGGSAIPVFLGGGQPTGASGTGGHYVVANNQALYLYNGSRFLLFGSQDPTDNNDTSITNIYGAVSNQYRTRAATSGWAPGNETRYPLIGVTDNGTVDKITATSSGSAAGVRPFTPNRISLFDNIFVSSQTTLAWPIDGIFPQALFSRINIAIANWRFFVGQYYNKAGVLTGNNVITDLNQVPFYIGGTKDGNYFVPKEFSVSLPTMPRAGIDVYKLIGYFTSAAANMYLTDYQTVYQFRNGQWVTLEALADGAVQIENLIPKESDLNTWKYMKEVEPGKYLYCCRFKVSSGTFPINTEGSPEFRLLPLTPSYKSLLLPNGNVPQDVQLVQLNSSVITKQFEPGGSFMRKRPIPSINNSILIYSGPQFSTHYCNVMDYGFGIFPLENIVTQPFQFNGLYITLQYQTGGQPTTPFDIEGLIHIIAE